MKNYLVYKALADPTRRKIMDLLFYDDGQSLEELTGQLPDITRFGVMKHLKVLEKASIVTSRRAGRKKFHYLNPVPIRIIYDRWVSKFAEPFANEMTNLKKKLEDGTMPEKSKHVFEIIIETTPEKLWNALTDGNMTKRYFHNTEALSDWKVGSLVRYRKDNGEDALHCEILEIESEKRLVTTFKHLWGDERENQEAKSKVIYEIEKMGSNLCKLSLVHEGLDPSEELFNELFSGWSVILSGLKTLLETGKPLAVGAS